ncbi:PAS domain S-box protein [Sphingomonas aracearum]|uniref:histidine kinase n=1 Tax=Sphingomonas aracearum TaxID=2283317 RepID=A0A369VUY2_9SPHN|nr:PAS domain S-box protein [Sphingomonas aracearum]
MRAYDLASLRDTKGLKQITDFASALCEAPIALVSIVEEEWQTFLSRTGLDAAQTPRRTSFCQFAMLGTGIMEVPDATRDPRFAENELVTGEPFIRFYAGAPLVADDGTPLGALCVIDRQPRPGLTALQREGLETLASAVLARLRDTRDALAWRESQRANQRALSESHERFRVLADTMPQMVWSTRPDGYHDYYNARWYEFTGMPEGSTDGVEWNGMFHPDDQERAWALWRHSLETGELYQIEYRLRRADGQYRWTLGRALPLRDEAGEITRWFGTCTEIHETKTASEERALVTQELRHRIKNILAVVTSLIGLTARSRPELRDASADLIERVAALGRAHDFVRTPGASSADASHDSLHALLGELLRPYSTGGENRITVSGDDVPIAAHEVTPMALLFHELATNAAKYGGLAETGRGVTIAIKDRGDATVIRWHEAAGEPVRPPQGSGFGSKLIDLSAVRQLRGQLERDWRPEGLQVTVHYPKR